MRRRLLAAGCLFALVAALLPVRAQTRVELEVVDSAGVAAAVGLITRVPAESPGGAVYAATSITADKSLARSAGFYPGYLVDAFFRTSSTAYSNPAEAAAQQPPGAYPEHAEVEGGVEGPFGEVARFVADAPDVFDATATAVVARFAAAEVPVTVGQASASSHSTVLDDGTVVTETTAVVHDLDVAGVLTAASLASGAVVRTPPVGQPTTTLRTSAAGLMLNGVPVTVTEDGLQASGQSIVPADAVAAVNEGLAMLAEAGVTVRAVPRQVDASEGAARVAGAALELGVNAGPNNPEEIVLLAQVGARSIAQAAAAPAALPFPDGAAQPPSVGGTTTEPPPLAVGVSVRPSPASVTPDAPGAPASGGGIEERVDPLTLLGDPRDDAVPRRVRHLYLAVLLLALLGVGAGVGLGRGVRAV